MQYRQAGTTRLLLLLLMGVAGCAQTPPPSSLHGPTKPVSITFKTWSAGGSPGHRVLSPHYVISSTISDRAMLAKIAELMEGALGEYHDLAPQIPLSNRPMQCYLFASRAQWTAFTKAHTGEDAAIYLRVNRGGYTVGDWFVAYWIGDTATFSVAAHEGWHQYVARHLKGRLPPFLEEGLACLFEQVQWEGELPRWDLTQNEPRLTALGSAMSGNKLYPLARLIRMHAGQVVGKPPSQIEAFYAESWAFARFLYDGDGGRHRPALSRMLADAARGTLYDDNSRQLSDGPLWDPATSKPMLEHYLGMSLPQIDRAFGRYLSQLIASPAGGAAGG